MDFVSPSPMNATGSSVNLMRTLTFSVNRPSQVNSCFLRCFQLYFTQQLNTTMIFSVYDDECAKIHLPLSLFSSSYITLAQ